VPCFPIQGQGHETFEVRNSYFQSIFSAIDTGSLQVASDFLTRRQYLNLIGPAFAYLA